MHRLLADAGSDARPRTAAELHTLLADALAVAQATGPEPGSAGAPRG